MDHLLIKGSLLDPSTKEPCTKMSSGGYKGTPGIAQRVEIPQISVIYHGHPFVVFDQSDRMEIYQFIVSITITYCQIMSNTIVINLGSNS